MSSIAKSSSLALGILLLAAGLRFFRIDLPLVEPYNSLTRQAICGEVARNFYKNGFNFLYPEIDENGRGPYLYNCEMQFSTFAMALLYRLTGGESAWAARSVTVIFSLALIWLMHRFVRERAGPAAACIAVLYLAVSPLMLSMSRSVQPDMLTLLFSAGTLYFYEKRRAVSAVFFLLAVLTRVFALYLFIPLLYLELRRQGARSLLKLSTIAYAACVLSGLVWYAWMWVQGMTQQLVYDPYRYAPNLGVAEVSYFQSLTLVNMLSVLKIFFIHLLTPVGTLLFFAGFLRRPDAHEELWYAWFAGILAYTLLFWQTVLQHPYYQLPFALPAAYFIAKGALRSAALLRRYGQRLRAAIVAAALLLTAATCVHFYKGLYLIPEKVLAIVSAGRAVDALTPKNALVLASYGSSTTQLFHCDRKGWAFNLLRPDDASVIEEFEKRRREGAEYFVAGSLEQLRALPAFYDHVERRSRMLKKDRDYALYDIRAVN